MKPADGANRASFVAKSEMTSSFMIVFKELRRNLSTAEDAKGAGDSKNFSHGNTEATRYPEPVSSFPLAKVD